MTLGCVIACLQLVRGEITSSLPFQRLLNVCNSCDSATVQRCDSATAKALFETFDACISRPEFESFIQKCQSFLLFLRFKTFPYLFFFFFSLPHFSLFSLFSVPFSLLYSSSPLLSNITE